MLQCLQCQCNNPDGTVLCNQCFSPLAPAAAAPVRLAPVQAGPPRVRWTLIENLQPVGSRLELPDLGWEGEILLGRTDLANQVIVDIDLSPLGGFEKKVSRRQARLRYQAGQVSLQDWESQHGTYVNKRRLDKQESQLLQAGDEIRLAHMIFRMEVL